MFPDGLPEAADHLRWLLDRGYPQNASVKLVGDRHRLDKAGRQILSRGVSSTADGARRSALIVPSGARVPGRLGIDGHNAALTVANYIAGVPVFEADDGLIRDIGALHGRLHDEELMRRSLELLVRVIPGIVARGVYAVFDAPLSHSRDHAAFFREISAAAGLDADVETVPSGDRSLIDAGIDAIATSDSALIDAVGRPVADLARIALEREFHPDFDSLVPGSPGT